MMDMSTQPSLHLPQKESVPLKAHKRSQVGGLDRYYQEVIPSYLRKNVSEHDQQKL